MSSHSVTIDRPDSDAMDRLCAELKRRSDRLDRPEAWPDEQLALCGRAGLFRALMPREAGGLGWDEAEQTSAYLRLSRACLTTTFVITQRMGACRRIAGSENAAVADAWLEPLLRGERFATVGISHLTTSRRHLGSAVLGARAVEGGFVLDGYSPWVTGGPFADLIVVGAELADGRQILAAVPTDQEGVRPHGGVSLVALSASRTDRVDFDSVRLSDSSVLAGPVEEVMGEGTGAATGGLQTSTLAVGLAGAAVELLEAEAARRDDLVEIVQRLSTETSDLERLLLESAAGHCDASTAELRQRANELVLRATQAALTATKGAGYVSGHPAGRMCREALFFLVWSCPQGVAHAHLCSLAGITA